MSRFEEENAADVGDTLCANDTFDELLLVRVPSERSEGCKLYQPGVNLRDEFKGGYTENQGNNG